MKIKKAISYAFGKGWMAGDDRTLSSKQDAAKEKEAVERATEAIYKAGLEAIGEEEKPHTKSRTSARHARNKLREKQAEAWAQLCGIEGESDV